MNWNNNKFKIILFIILILLMGSFRGTAEENQELIELQVRNAEIEDVLVMLSEQSGVNLVPDKTVSGEVSLNIEDYIFQDVLEILEHVYGYHLKKISPETYFISGEEFSYSPEVEIEKGLLTLQAENTSIKELMNIISEKAEINIIMDDSVDGNITADLDEIPIREGLFTILESSGFSLYEDNEIYRVSDFDRGSGENLEISVVDNKVSLDVEGVDLAYLMRTIARLSDIELALYGDLKEEINLKIEEKPVEEVLEMALKGTEATYKQMEGIYVVGSRNLDDPASSLVTDSEIINLNELRAKEVFSFLPPGLTEMEIELLEEQNALLVTGTESEIKQLEDYIENIDQEKYSSEEQEFISLTFSEAKIDNVLDQLSEEAGINLVLDESVQGRVSLDLKKVQLDEIFEILNLAYGHRFEKVGQDTYFVSNEEYTHPAEIEVQDNYLTMEVEGEDVRRVLDIIAEEAGVNIIKDESVEGEISANLEDVPFEKGLMSVLQAHGYSVSASEDIYEVVEVDVYQRDDQLDISVVDDRVSMDVQSADLSEILHEISRQSNTDMVIYGSIRENIDLRLKDQPIEEVFQLIMGGTDFTYQKEEGMYLIGDKKTGSPAAEEFILSEVVEINHLRAEEIPSLLPPDVSEANIKVLDKQNALFVTGTQAEIKSLKQHIDRVDERVPQIVIEALVVEISESEKRGPEATLGMDYNEDDTFIDTSLGRLTYQSVLDLPDNFHLEIQSLVEKGEARIKARPNITTLNNEQAEIDIGTVQYYEEATTQDDEERIRYRSIDAGVNLRVTPWVNNSGEITMDVNPEISNISGAVTEGPPEVSRRSADSTVRVKDGETVVLGGLIQDVVSETETRVPYLSEIPLLGELFRSESTDADQTELVIYLTPYIMEEEQEDENIIDVDFREIIRE